MKTSAISLSLRGVPGIGSLSLRGAESRTTLDSDRQLVSVGLCPNLLCVSKGTNYYGESGSDPYVSWGRWKGGAIEVRILGAAGTIDLSFWQGMHYLVGVPTTVMPTSGSFGYSLSGATLATTSDGAVAPGTLSASAVVQFAPGTATRVGLTGSISFSQSTISFSSNGGLTNPAASNITMNQPNSFSGNLSTTQSGANLLNCAGSGCTTQLRGGFFGPEARRMGIDYTVSGSDGGRTISGVGVLNKQ